MALGTFAICPVKPSPSKEFCAPIKNGEYWAMGLPVVIKKNISIDSKIISENNIGYVLDSTTKNEYLNAVKKIDELIKVKELKKRIRKIAVHERNFNDSRKIYESIYK